MGLPKASTRGKRNAARLVPQTTAVPPRGVAVLTATEEAMLQAAEQDESKAAAERSLAAVRLRAEGTETLLARAVLERGETERYARAAEAKVHANKMTANSAGVSAAEAGAVQAEWKAIAARQRFAHARATLTDSEVAASTTAALKQDADIAAAAASQRVKEALEAEALAVERSETARHHAEKAEARLIEARVECHRSERDLALSETEFLAAKAGVVEAVHQHNIHAELAGAAVNRLIDSEETVAGLARRSADATARTLARQADLEQQHAKYSVAAQHLQTTEKITTTAVRSRELAQRDVLQAVALENAARDRFDQFARASSGSVVAAVRGKEVLHPALKSELCETTPQRVTRVQPVEGGLDAAAQEKGEAVGGDRTPDRCRRYANLQSPAYLPSPERASSQQQQQQESPESPPDRALDTTLDSTAGKPAVESAHRLLSG